MTDEEREKERKRTRRKILAAEALLLYLLLRSRKKSPNSTTAYAAVLYKAKREARALARKRIAAETGIKLGVRPERSPKSDMKRSTQIASRFVTFSKEKQATIPSAETKKVEQELKKQADKSVQNRLRQIAAFEMFSAFEDERRLASKEIARQTGDRVLKKWDAVLDSRTCSECFASHGEEIPLDSEFVNGDPPLHPYCRCSLEYRFDT